MAQYLVRNGFCVHKGEQKFPEKSVLELNDEEFKLYAHQVEPIPVKVDTKTKQKEGEA